MNDSFFSPNNGVLQGHKPMKRMPEFEHYDSIEDLYKYGTKQGGIGAYKPVKILPSKRINTNAKMPIVFNAGDIVSIKNIKAPAAYTDLDTETGILASGEVYYTIGEDGVGRKISIDAYYEQQIAGLLVPANGSASHIDLPYTDACGENGIILADGTEASQSSDPYRNEPNLPMGLLDGAVYADLAHRWLNYEFEQRAVGITRGGILVIPYVAVIDANSSNRTTILNALKAALDTRHQYAIFAEDDLATVEGLFAAGTYLKPTNTARFEKWVLGTDNQNLKYAEVLSRADRTPYYLDDIVDTFPGSHIRGTDTGGLTKRMFDFVSTICKLPSVKTTDEPVGKKTYIASLVGVPKETNTGTVKILFGQLEIAFGTAMKS